MPEVQEDSLRVPATTDVSVAVLGAEPSPPHLMQICLTAQPALSQTLNFDQVRRFLTAVGQNSQNEKSSADHVGNKANRALQE